jgi:hypothetical protein
MREIGRIEGRREHLVLFKHGPELWGHVREAAGGKISNGAALFLLLLVDGPLDVPLLLLNTINFLLLVVCESFY